MCKDKKMFSLIIAIFIMVLFITGWVFADRSVMDLITATPIFDAQNTASAPAVPADDASIGVSLPDYGMCSIDGSCG